MHHLEHVLSFYVFMYVVDFYALLMLFCAEDAWETPQIVGMIHMIVSSLSSRIYLTGTIVIIYIILFWDMNNKITPFH